MSHNGNDIFRTTNGSLGDSLGTGNHNKKVKTKRARSSWVEPLNGLQPNIIFDPKKPSFEGSLFKHMAFAIKLCHLSI
jgi:hypothetical protein